MYKMAISMQYYATGLGYNVTPKSFSEEPEDYFHQIIIISFQLSFNGLICLALQKTMQRTF